ncbi:MAG: MogA/MoaB family molybdenum cofactor biosynthesis protein [Synergistales bacterium]|nr:MogA/MoaB family molybdenum cofactor biosynthesis protein [Synergistales bacterium]MDD4022981.1 MogA/MoaB family molybdenum cofactor biosynthesis protein [Synergistales bacterium]HPE91654.1 MogA/MoaB family molybdenum cofactor biosynthesis protein [Synergistales bacterium]
MKRRVLGFSGRFGDRPLVYIHSDEKGGALVDGSPLGIVLAGAGEGELGEGLFGIIVSEVPEIDPGDFLQFSDGVILKKSPENGTKGSFHVASKGFLSVSSLFCPWTALKVGILTVSDKGSRGEREDTSGPALEKSVHSIGGFASMTGIVPDETESISGRIREWIASGMDIILVTGGTGISRRDVTPEAVRSLGGKEIPGIGEYMRWKTSFDNERSILSRSVAVACSGTIVVTLPGSERGAVQCFYSIAPVLRHAVEIVTGRSGDCAGSHR